MRDIKFRAFYNGTMLSHTFDISLKDGGCCYPNIFIHDIPENNDHALLYSFGRSVKLMQFTGLLDKNGKEIYENDVVKILYTDWVDQSNYSIGKVVFEEDRYWVSIYSKKYGEYCLSPIYPGKYGWIEVIGNIFESPELLEVKNEN
jgi:hypothetical protein